MKLLQMAHLSILNDELHITCFGTIDSAELTRWFNSANPKIVYSECWDGVVTPNLKQTTIGLVARQLFERNINDGTHKE